MYGLFSSLIDFHCVGVLVTQNECAMEIIIEHKIKNTNALTEEYYFHHFYL